MKVENKGLIVNTSSLSPSAGDKLIDYGSNDYNSTSVQSVKIDSKIKTLMASMSPEIGYCISSTISINVKLGGVQYMNQDIEENADYFNINFNPNNWVVGMKIKI